MVLVLVSIEFSSSSEFILVVDNGDDDSGDSGKANTVEDENADESSFFTIISRDTTIRTRHSAGRILDRKMETFLVDDKVRSPIVRDIVHALLCQVRIGLWRQVGESVDITTDSGNSRVLVYQSIANR